MSKKPLVIITGSGRGIGAATAIECAKEGYYVCVNYLANEQAAHRVVDVIKREGGDAVAIQADVSCPSDVERLFESVDQLFQSILMAGAYLLYLRYFRVSSLSEYRSGR